MFKLLQGREHRGQGPRCLYKTATDDLYFLQRLKLDKKLSVHDGCVNTINWNDNGTLILSGSDDQHLAITDPFTGKNVAKFRSGHRSNIFSAKFLPGSMDREVVSCSGSGEIFYTDVDRTDAYGTNRFDCHFGTTYKLLVVPNEAATFLSCGDDGTVRFFDLRTKTSCSKFNCEEDVVIHLRNAVTAMAVDSVIPFHLAVASSDGIVRLYDRRMLKTRETGGSSDNLICRFLPPMKGAEKRHYRITSLNYRQGSHDVLVNYSSENIYLFNTYETNKKQRFSSRPQAESSGSTSKPVSMTGPSRASNGGAGPSDSEATSAGAATTDNGADSESAFKPIKRLRLRGDWSDTGPDARPESEEPALTNTIMQRMSDLLTRMLNSRSDRGGSQEEDGEEEGATGGNRGEDELAQPEEDTRDETVTATSSEAAAMLRSVMFRSANAAAVRSLGNQGRPSARYSISSEGLVSPELSSQDMESGSQGEAALPDSDVSAAPPTHAVTAGTADSQEKDIHLSGISDTAATTSSMSPVVESPTVACGEDNLASVEQNLCGVNDSDMACIERNQETVGETEHVFSDTYLSKREETVKAESKEMCVESAQYGAGGKTECDMNVDSDNSDTVMEMGTPAGGRDGNGVAPPAGLATNKSCDRLSHISSAIEETSVQGEAVVSSDPRLTTHGTQQPMFPAMLNMPSNQASMSPTNCGKLRSGVTGEEKENIKVSDIKMQSENGQSPSDNLQVATEVLLSPAISNMESESLANESNVESNSESNDSIAEQMSANLHIKSAVSQSKGTADQLNIAENIGVPEARNELSMQGSSQQVAPPVKSSVQARRHTDPSQLQSTSKGSSGQQILKTTGTGVASAAESCTPDILSSGCTSQLNSLFSITPSGSGSTVAIAEGALSSYEGSNSQRTLNDVAHFSSLPNLSWSSGPSLTEITPTPTYSRDSAKNPSVTLLSQVSQALQGKGTTAHHQPSGCQSTAQPTVCTDRLSGLVKTDKGGEHIQTTIVDQSQEGQELAPTDYKPESATAGSSAGNTNQDISTSTHLTESSTPVMGFFTSPTSEVLETAMVIPGVCSSCQEEFATRTRDLDCLQVQEQIQSGLCLQCFRKYQKEQPQKGCSEAQTSPGLHGHSADIENRTALIGTENESCVRPVSQEPAAAKGKVDKGKGVGKSSLKAAQAGAKSSDFTPYNSGKMKISSEPEQTLSSSASPDVSCPVNPLSVTVASGQCDTPSAVNIFTQGETSNQKTEGSGAGGQYKSSYKLPGLRSHNQGTDRQRRVGYSLPPTGNFQLHGDDSESEEEEPVRGMSLPKSAAEKERMNQAVQKIQEVYRKKREARELAKMMEVPQPRVLMKYSGHRNCRTMIKEANFYGDHYVVSGSDCGRILAWERETGRMVMYMDADRHVVNCVQPNLYVPVLASSGIDYDIKIWGPLEEEPQFDEDKAEMIIRRNELMLEETRDTVTVPAAFMLRILASLSQIRTGRNAGRGQAGNESQE